jgi:hypothetical protein
VPALLQELKARRAGVAMEAIIQGNPVAFVRDNTGNLIEFVTEAAFQ